MSSPMRCSSLRASPTSSPGCSRKNSSMPLSASPISSTRATATRNETWPLCSAGWGSLAHFARPWRKSVEPGWGDFDTRRPVHPHPVRVSRCEPTSSLRGEVKRDPMELIVEHASHAFGSLEVLDDVSFAVSSGEVLAVVGPSGCGKSTLLSIVGGLIEPVRGHVALRGDLPPQSLNPITFVFQDFALL